MAIGVDVGGTKCLAVALAGAEMRAEQKVGTPGDPHRLVDTIAALVERMAGHLPGGDPAVGVGLPGLVDRAGTLRMAPHLGEAVGSSLGPSLSQRMGRPVRVENDATCAAWAESQVGAGVGAGHMLALTLGTGIGGGFVSGGRLVRGSNGFAGEFGHMVVRQGGRPCPCGRRGCWEQYASGSALGTMARAEIRSGRARAVAAVAGSGRPDGTHVAIAAASGDLEAREMIAEIGREVAVGVANLIHIVDPDLVVVGGGLADLDDLLMDPARRALGAILADQGRPDPPPLVIASLGMRAGAVGAALLAREGDGLCKQPWTTGGTP
ncbi:MAG: ROK family protein [Acidimicrobiales bacterium]